MIGKYRNVTEKAKNILDLWHFQLRNYASDVGIMDGNSNYTPFILLGTARTGSNFLRSLLNAHNQIIAFGEVFRHYDTIGWDFSYIYQSESMLSLIQNDPVKFLETRVYGNFPKRISAAGFKIFYYHAHNDAWEPVWTYLANQKELKIIHVKRKNILKRHLSIKRAFMTDVWTSQRVVNSKYNTPISLNYEECLEDFTQTLAWERQYDAFFESHAKIDVLYENLANDYRSEMRRIQEFLGVDYENVRPKTIKQSDKQPLSNVIINFFELKERFEGTLWEEFFED